MFGRTSASKKIIAVADVGNASAGVAILAINTEGPATVIDYERVALPFEDRSERATAIGFREIQRRKVRRDERGMRIITVHWQRADVVVGM